MCLVPKSNCRLNARGVAILFNNNFEYKISEIHADTDINYVALTISIGDQQLTLFLFMVQIMTIRCFMKI